MLESHARGGVWTAICDPFPSARNSGLGLNATLVQGMPAGAPPA
jgi:hypothetical protein